MGEFRVTHLSQPPGHSVQRHHPLSISLSYLSISLYTFSTLVLHQRLGEMQQNWQQGQYGGYGQQQQPPQQQQQQTGGGGGFLGSQPTGFGGMGGMGPQPTGYGGMGGMGMGMSGMGGMGGMGQQPTGFGQQQQRPPSISPLPTGQSQQQSQQGGGYSFLNTQPTGFRPSFTGSSGGGGMGMNPQMTGFAGGGASGLMSQPTGFQGGSGLMSQPTGMGMMSQPTGMGGLRAQPTGVHDPRLQTMMQSFMPSNLSQVSYSSFPPASFDARAHVSAIQQLWRRPIQPDPTTTTSTTIPILAPEPISQDAQSPLGAHKTRKERLRPDL